MVEMPVIPGTGKAMRRLLDRLDQVGAFGINLLEFCYPMGAWDEFERRGFSVKNPPFPVLYTADALLRRWAGFSLRECATCAAALASRRSSSSFQSASRSSTIGGGAALLD